MRESSMNDGIQPSRSTEINIEQFRKAESSEAQVRFMEIGISQVLSTYL